MRTDDVKTRAMAGVWPRLLSWVVCAVVGVLYGTAGTISHAYRPGGVPVGLLLSLVGVTALLVGVRLLTEDRWCALAAGIGAVAATLLLSGTGPGGSVIIPGGALDEVLGVNLGMVWAVGLMAAVTVVTAWPDLHGLRARTGR